MTPLPQGLAYAPGFRPASTADTALDDPEFLFSAKWPSVVNGTSSPTEEPIVLFPEHDSFYAVRSSTLQQCQSSFFRDLATKTKQPDFSVADGSAAIAVPDHPLVFGLVLGYLHPGSLDSQQGRWARAAAIMLDDDSIIDNYVDTCPDLQRTFKDLTHYDPREGGSILHKYGFWIAIPLLEAVDKYDLGDTAHSDAVRELEGVIYCPIEGSIRVYELAHRLNLRRLAATFAEHIVKWTLQSYTAPRMIAPAAAVDLLQYSMRCSGRYNHLKRYLLGSVLPTTTREPNRHTSVQYHPGYSAYGTEGQSEHGCHAALRDVVDLQLKTWIVEKLTPFTTEHGINGINGVFDDLVDEAKQRGCDNCLSCVRVLQMRVARHVKDLPVPKHVM